MWWEFPSGPVVTFGFFTAVAWVQFLLEKLRSHKSMCCSQKQKKKKKTVGMVAPFQEYTKLRNSWGEVVKKEHRIKASFLFLNYRSATIPTLEHCK